MSKFDKRSKIMYECRKNLENHLPDSAKIDLRYKKLEDGQVESLVQVKQYNRFYTARKQDRSFQKAFTKARRAILRQINKGRELKKRNQSLDFPDISPAEYFYT